MSAAWAASTCYGFEDKGVKIAAASKELWDDGKICGRRLEVRCTSGMNNGVAVPCKEGENVHVIVTDLCPPERCHGTIDLSQEAFMKIADRRQGVINIEYTYLP
ncbi:hypothetical protein HPP92_009157 [Vanilla planifolia]|uniref:Expansin-like EG45 domain-containing protein n=1 Tax=Vanilla planifolia TaxID=51239 RepID=A0A835V561_VANPL|nr:hypothetical protein HPP92_009157 [Vanilla planifolia]